MGFGRAVDGLHIHVVLRTADPERPTTAFLLDPDGNNIEADTHLPTCGAASVVLNGAG